MKHHDLGFNCFKYGAFSFVLILVKAFCFLMITSVVVIAKFLFIKITSICHSKALLKKLIQPLKQSD